MTVCSNGAGRPFDFLGRCACAFPLEVYSKTSAAFCQNSYSTSATQAIVKFELPMNLDAHLSQEDRSSPADLIPRKFSWKFRTEPRWKTNPRPTTLNVLRPDFFKCGKIAAKSTGSP